MKTLLATLFLIAATVAGFAQSKTSNQPLEILMIGTSHDYGKKATEKFDYVMDKVRAYQPDAVFGEFLSAEDYDAIPNYWNKANVEKRIAYVRDLGYPLPANREKLIAQSYKALKENPNYHQDRMKLTNALVQQHDFANAQYQLYQLMQRKDAFGAEERATFTKTLGPIDSLHRLGYRTTSEYYYMLFPLMNELKIDKMMSMDCQKYDLAWQGAWDRADTLVRLFEAQVDKDSTSAEALAYKALNQRTSVLNKLSKTAEREGVATKFYNSIEGDEFLNIVNFYGGKRLFSVKGFPEKELSEMLRYWQLRNEGMCQNIVSRARAAGVKRVVVGVGANHRKIMVDLLRAYPGVTVYELNDYQPK
jgi:hypothetical protein